MDALSDALSMLRVRSMLSSRFEGTGVWALHFPVYTHVKFGCVMDGQLYLWVEGTDTPQLLEKGDFYLLTHGQSFFTASDPSAPALDGPATYRAIRGADGVVRYRGTPDDTILPVSLASGRFVFEDDAADVLLKHLPGFVHLRARDTQTGALSLLLELLKFEMSDTQPGTEVARSGLAAMVLVNALRAFLASGPAMGGWLGALGDPKVGAALSLMHGRPNERWTVERLASSVSMSRTAFAAHFRRAVGSAPLEYLNRWRMMVARDALRHSDQTLFEVADRVGYLSDTAFSIAFKRFTGQSPGRFRAQFRSAPQTSP